jgi:serine phosphatase RsbU (regulator of sigma subunit)
VGLRVSPFTPSGSEPVRGTPPGEPATGVPARTIVPPSADERLRRFDAVTSASLVDLDLPDLLVELLDRVRDLLAVDTAAVLLLDPTGSELVATAARGIEEEVRQGVRIPMGKGFAGRIAASREPVMIEQINEFNVVNPILRERGIRSLLGVPMVAGGEVIGIVHVGSLVRRRFTEDEAELLQLVADRLALATQVRLSSAERAAAVALQRSLLPERLPEIPGLDLAARYLPGEGGVGGDWYDVYPLPSGEVAITIGDVAGRGLRAAVVMGRLRSKLRAIAFDEGDPGQVLARLDETLRHFEPGEMATVVFAVLDPDLGRLRVAAAGHPPPLLAVPGAPSRLLDVPVGPPIGVPFGRPRQIATVDVPPGALLCLYTDGLVERRGVLIDDGLARLCDTVQPGPARPTCISLVAEFVGNTSPEDDLAVLVVARTDGPSAPDR